MWYFFIILINGIFIFYFFFSLIYVNVKCYRKFNLLWTVTDFFGEQKTQQPDYMFAFKLKKKMTMEEVFPVLLMGLNKKKAVQSKKAHL